MKKSIWMLGLSLVLLIAFGINVQGQSKEVTESGITTYYVTAKLLPLEEGGLYMSYEAIGATVNDTGEGLFHNATVRVLGGMKIEKGIYKDERSWGVFNLQNGDKVFFTYGGSGEVKPEGVGIAKGTTIITGGTGKCAGIQGTFDLTRYTPRSSVAVPGAGLSYIKGTVKYKLP
jgi:hypothetical protein